MKSKDPVDKAKKRLPVIIARFTSRDIRDQFYIHHNLLRSAKLSDFLAPETEKIFVIKT